MNMEQLKIKQAVLKAVRKISGAAFNKKLGNYSVNFSSCESTKIISMSLVNDCGLHRNCFHDVWIGASSTFLTLFPENLSDIERFEVSVESALADVFEFVKNNHE